MRAPQFLRPKRSLSTRLALGLIMAAVAALSAWAFAGDTGTASADGTTIVNVSATAPEVFLPKNITVDTNTTIRWVANGPLPHTITADGCGDPAAGACTFDSGATFDSVIQSTGDKKFYEYKFTSPGVYSYYCRVHGAPGGVGQAGTITVQAPSGQTGPAPIIAASLRPSASAVVYSPKEGETVVGDKLNISLAINGAQLRAPVPLQTNRVYGHFNLLLDAANPDLSGNQIGGAGVTRANTTTATIENVKPGPHTLIAVWTYDNNVPPQPPIMYTVKFTTVAAPDGGAAAAAPSGGTATALKPPATGDGGLLGRGGGSSTNLYLASGVLLLAALGLGYRMRDRA